MFSGLIQHIGRVTSNQSQTLKIEAPVKKVRKGDSIAVSGVCLTVTSLTRGAKGKSQLGFDISEETLQKTCLRNLKPGVSVNIETALTLADALGGHLVQGHV